MMKNHFQMFQCVLLYDDPLIGGLHIHSRDQRGMNHGHMIVGDITQMR